MVCAGVVSVQFGICLGLPRSQESFKTTYDHADLQISADSLDLCAAVLRDRVFCIDPDSRTQEDPVREDVRNERFIEICKMHDRSRLFAPAALWVRGSETD